MKNSKGFIRFEVLTIFVLVIAIVAGGLYFILGSTGRQKYDTFRDNAMSLGKTVSTNSDSFNNYNITYLSEVLDESLLKNNIKNPFSSGYCDETESKVQHDAGRAYVTLKCGNYLIDNASLNDKKEMKIYLVSEWTDEALSDDEDIEQRTMYNCVDSNGNNVFDTYYEDMYLVYKVNKKFNVVHYLVDEISECTVTSKEMYRSKVLSDEGN